MQKRIRHQMLTMLVLVLALSVGSHLALAVEGDVPAASAIQEEAQSVALVDDAVPGPGEPVQEEAQPVASGDETSSVEVDAASEADEGDAVAVGDEGTSPSADEAKTDDEPEEDAHAQADQNAEDPAQADDAESAVADDVSDGGQHEAEKADNAARAADDEAAVDGDERDKEAASAAGADPSEDVTEQEEADEADAPKKQPEGDKGTEEADGTEEQEALAEVRIDAAFAKLVMGEDGTYALLPCDEAGSVTDGPFAVAADDAPVAGLEKLFIDEGVTKLDVAQPIAVALADAKATTTFALLAPTDVIFMGTSVPEVVDEALVFANTPIAAEEGWIYVPALACAAFEEALPSWAHRIVSMADDGLDLLPSAGPTPGWVRLWGENAYDTMQKVVQADLVFQDKRGGSVIVATGDGYWDALAASGLAGRLDAPVIITPKDSLCAQAKSEIARLKPERIYIMGGKAAVSADVETQLKKLCPKVTRVKGATAPDTAVKIYEAAPSWGDTAIVATCNGYWDALSIAPYSYAKGAPIFLTLYSDAPEGRVLSQAALDAIKLGGFSRVIITGGKAAVSEKVESQLAGIGVGMVVRKSGKTALDTSAEIAKWEVASEGMSIDNLTVATSNGYWDALSAAAYVGHFGSVLVLVDNDGHYQAFDAVYDYDHPEAVSFGRVLGGKAAISAEAYDRITSAWALSSVAVSETCVPAGTKITVTPKLLGDTSGLKYNYVWSRNGSTQEGEWGSTLKQTGSYATGTSGPMTFNRSGSYTVTIEAIDGAGKTQKSSRMVYVWKLDSLEVTGQGDGSWVATPNWGIDASKVKDVEYRFTWKRNEDGATGVIRDWGTGSKATFSEATFGYVGGTYTITVEARKGGASVGTASKSVQVDDMSMKAQGYSSSTGYLIMVDCTDNRVGIYTGSYGNWSRIRYNVVSTGAPWTPTVKGVFTVGIKGYEFGEGYSCYYYTQFYGDYLFHTILYDPGTFNVQDGRLGESISHGCVRMSLEDAKWIWDIIPYGTTVVVYD